MRCDFLGFGVLEILVCEGLGGREINIACSFGDLSKLSRGDLLGF